MTGYGERMWVPSSREYPSPYNHTFIERIINLVDRKISEDEELNK